MEELLQKLDLGGLVSVERLLSIVRAVVVLVLGLLLTRIVSSALGRTVRARVGVPEGMIVRRLTSWVLAGLVIVTTMHQLGFQLGVLLGAAGVLTVAVGFASQTSASNFISGLFLMFERPFVVGDVIRIDDQTGEVLSIDLLSVKLRTFDNLFVRIPNEDIIKKHITNLTHFPIRRVDLVIGVGYGEDLQRVRALLDEVADRNPLCMNEPKPLFIFQAYGDSALQFKYAVWGARGNYLELLNSMYVQIKAAFDEHGIEIPFPHRSLYAGEHTRPLPVRLVAAEEEG